MSDGLWMIRGFDRADNDVVADDDHDVVPTILGKPKM